MDWLDMHKQAQRASADDVKNKTTSKVDVLSGELEKLGARHSKQDKGHVQDAHDAFAALADAAHCMPENTTKVGARKSKADMDKIKQGHDLAKALGADCPGMKQTGA